MNISSKLQALFSDLEKLGFSVYCHGSNADRQPANNVTLVKRIGVMLSGELSPCSVSITLHIDDADRITAKLDSLVGLVNLSCGDFSYPHPHFEKMLDVFTRSTQASLHEVKGNMDREYLPCMLTEILKLLDQGKISRALGLAKQALAEFNACKAQTFAG